MKNLLLAFLTLIFMACGNKPSQQALQPNDVLIKKNDIVNGASLNLPIIKLDKDFSIGYKNKSIELPPHSAPNPIEQYSLASTYSWYRGSENNPTLDYFNFVLFNFNQSTELTSLLEMNSVTPQDISINFPLILDLTRLKSYGQPSSITLDFYLNNQLIDAKSLDIKTSPVKRKNGKYIFNLSLNNLSQKMISRAQQTNTSIRMKIRSLHFSINDVEYDYINLVNEKLKKMSQLIIIENDYYEVFLSKKKISINDFLSDHKINLMTTSSNILKQDLNLFKLNDYYDEDGYWHFVQPKYKQQKIENGQQAVISYITKKSLLKSWLYNKQVHKAVLSSVNGSNDLIETKGLKTNFLQISTPLFTQNIFAETAKAYKCMTVPARKFEFLNIYTRRIVSETTFKPSSIDHMNLLRFKINGQNYSYKQLLDSFEFLKISEESLLIIIDQNIENITLTYPQKHTTCTGRCHPSCPYGWAQRGVPPHTGISTPIYPVIEYNIEFFSDSTI